MTNDFESKLADLVWSLIEPKIEQKLANFRDDLGTFDGDLDDKISDWMSGNFRLDDYQFDLDGMIDQQVEYLAEYGDLKEWLKDDNTSDDETLRLKVIDIIGDITVGFEVK
jgi:hypothetical protein